jgi:ABC-type sugar transport system ATPase subunit
MPDVSLDHRRVSLQLAGISKTYGATRVVSEVDLSVGRGEVVALMGANGAGKSTLAKIASGVVQPDSGHILVGGRNVKLAGPRAARSHGIFIVHQSTGCSRTFCGRKPGSRRSLQRQDRAVY